MPKKLVLLFSLSRGKAVCRAGRALGSGLVSGVGSDGGRGGSQCDRGFAGFVFLYVVRAGRWGVGLGLFFGPWTVHHVVRPSLVLWFSLSRG